MKKLIFILLLLAVVYFAYRVFVSNDTRKDIERSLTTTPIEKLLADPRYYENKEVSVYGTVESSFSLGIKYYVLNDKTGTIYIITEKGVPQEGEFVQVTGIFNQRIKIGNLQVETITEKQ